MWTKRMKGVKSFFNTVHGLESLVSAPLEVEKELSREMEFSGKRRDVHLK